MFFKLSGIPDSTETSYVIIYSVVGSVLLKLSISSGVRNRTTNLKREPIRRHSSHHVISIFFKKKPAKKKMSILVSAKKTEKRNKKKVILESGCVFSLLDCCSESIGPPCIYFSVDITNKKSPIQHYSKIKISSFLLSTFCRRSKRLDKFRAHRKLSSYNYRVFGKSCAREN